MDNQENIIGENEIPVTSNENTTPLVAVDQSKIDALNELQDDIIRNDTIPETSRTTPGSSGVFPVGAFENNKD